MAKTLKKEEQPSVSPESIADSTQPAIAAIAKSQAIMRGCAALQRMYLKTPVPLSSRLALSHWAEEVAAQWLHDHKQVTGVTFVELASSFVRLTASISKEAKNAAMDLNARCQSRSAHATSGALRISVAHLPEFFLIGI